MLYRPPQHHQLPAFGGAAACPLIPRAVVLPRPRQNLQVTAEGGALTRPFIPRAIVLPRPPQHLQLAAPSGRRTTRCGRPTGSHAPAPIAAAPGARPEQRLHKWTRPTHSLVPAPTATPLVPALSGGVACPPVPLAAVLPRPPQHIQTPAPSDRCARRRFQPTAASRNCPHKLREGLAKRVNREPRPVREVFDARPTARQAKPEGLQSLPAMQNRPVQRATRVRNKTGQRVGTRWNVAHLQVK